MFKLLFKIFTIKKGTLIDTFVNDYGHTVKIYTRVDTVANKRHKEDKITCMKMEIHNGL